MKLFDFLYFIAIQLTIDEAYKYYPINIFESKYGYNILISNSLTSGGNIMNVQLFNVSGSKIPETDIVISLARQNF